MSRVEDTYNALEEKGFSRERIAIGYLDEASPQTTANTVRFWHVGCGDIVKNTSKYQSNTIGFYAAVGRNTIDFLQNSKKESIANFLTKIKQANMDYDAIIVVLDNYSSHTSYEVKNTADTLGISLLFLPPYCPDLNPIEQIWKSIKREISVEFIYSNEYLKSVISDSWAVFSKSSSYAKGWIEQFVPWVLYG